MYGNAPVSGCASPSSVLWVRESKPSEWNHESHETHEKEDRGTASDSLAERVRHPTPRDILHHDTLRFSCISCLSWLDSCVCGWAKPLPTNGTHTPSLSVRRRGPQPTRVPFPHELVNLHGCLEPEESHNIMEYKVMRRSVELCCRTRLAERRSVRYAKAVKCVSDTILGSGGNFDCNCE